MLVGVITFIIYILNVYVDYTTLLIPYKKGNYEIVQGSVDDINIPTFEEKKSEYFSIDGVPFELSPGVFGMGYKKVASHGGAITHNGQIIRIGYINCDERNIIVKLEIAKQ